MKRLIDIQSNESGQFTAINGDSRFVSRITSIGLTPGCKVTVVKNDANGKPACSACMPKDGFKNMGIMWEVVS